MRLVFLGPPGVGKGTHAEIAGKEFSIPAISTGQILREEIEKGSELGKMVSKYVEKGVLVPDEIVIEILKKRISQDDCKNGFILDGFPRTLNQAKELETITHIDLVVNFVASHETIIARISNRLTCRKCGAIYNTLFMKPKVDGICDVCGGELYRRPDQDPAVVKKRLEVYEKETKPLIDYYKEKGILIDVNVEGEKDEVSKRIRKAILDFFEKRK
ncbi:MAG: adenylate kinase [Candidatus Aenigmatarchaeota archaeon]|nr:MAG: adenylate kinase [Candidatus Aenigmarchaeota archaeon]